MKIKTIGVLAGLCTVAGFQQAQAHVDFARPSVAAEKTAVIPLQVPQAEPGWQLEVTRGDYARAGIKPHSPQDPALGVLVADATGQGGHDHGAMHMETDTDAAAGAGVTGMAKAGDIAVEGAYARAMLPGQPVGGGYLTIRNAGSSDDRLVSAASSVAGAVEIHEMAMQGETMRMRKLDGGVDVPAGQVMEFKPGGLHLMFTKVKTPFKAGESVPLTLTFEKAGKIDVTLPVNAIGAPAKKD